MAVRYFRECIEGEWVDIRLSDDELNKLRRATVRSVAKCIKLVKEEATALAADQKDPVTLSPAEVLVIAQKVAPGYHDVVSDFIRNRVWQKKHPASPPPAQAPAAAK